MKRYQLHSKKFRKLELIGRKTEEPCGYIRLWKSENLKGEYYFKFKGFEPCSFDLEQNKDYELEIKGLEISLAYLCEQDHILDDGVYFVMFNETNLQIIENNQMDHVYSQEFRNRFHFAPFKNWMNDPNGLCYFKGYYHLFYQYNPNGFQWGNMHWGHAASKDLLHWKHLPIAAYPQVELQDNDNFRGGAFSGSSVVTGNTMHLFYTRHFGRVDRTWQRQWQVTKQTSDGIHFSQEQIIIWGTPEGVFYDFRDPKVEWINNSWTMVLGGTVNDIPAILLYTSDNLKKWTYQGVLLEEKNPIYSISECPDLFYLDGKYVLTAGFIYSEYATEKRRDTKYYIGQLNGTQFLVESEGIYDYGKDFYAVQSFNADGRRISIGWNCGLEAVHEKNSSNGTMSIPREMKLENGMLKMLPIKEFHSLFDTQSPCLISEKGFKAEAPMEYVLNLKSENALFLSVILASNKEKELRLTAEGNSISLCTGDINDICIVNTCENITDLEIFVDRSLIEIFINNGRYTCTRRYFISERQQQIYGRFLNKNYPINVSLRPIKGIWKSEGGEQ